MSDDSFNYHLGTASQNRREAARKTRAMVASRIGVSESTIYRFERGETRPRDLRRFLDLYCEAIGCDHDALWAEALGLQPNGSPVASPRRHTLVLTLVGVLAVTAAAPLIQRNAGPHSLFYTALLSWTQVLEAAAFPILALIFWRFDAPRAVRLCGLAYCAAEGYLRAHLAINLITGHTVLDVPAVWEVLYVLQAAAIWLFLFGVAIHYEHSKQTTVRGLPASNASDGKV